jgi:hypothetical protein
MPVVGVCPCRTRRSRVLGGVDGADGVASVISIQRMWFHGLARGNREQLNARFSAGSRTTFEV